MVKKVLKTFIILLVLIILLYPFSITGDIYHKNIAYPNNKTPIIEPEEENIDINTLRSNYGNNDILAYVKIDSISLESVVLKTSDNDYYLNHDVYKNKSIYGVPFIDYRNKKDLSSEKQINIYGHNSRVEEFLDDLPFSNLRYITDENTFNNLSDIYLFTENDVLIYEPYIVKVITTDYEYTRLKFVNDEVLHNHLNNLVSNTMYCKDECYIPDDKDIIILQTCFYNPRGSYLLLIGIR